MTAVSQIVACAHARHEAMRRHDVNRLDRVLDERPVRTQPNAASDDKPACSGEVADATFAFGAIGIIIERVTMFGVAAHVPMRMSADITVSAVREAIGKHGLAVWLKTAAGAWKLAAPQPTPIVGV